MNSCDILPPFHLFVHFGIVPLVGSTANNVFMHNFPTFFTDQKISIIKCMIVENGQTLLDGRSMLMRCNITQRASDFMTKLTQNLFISGP